MNRTRVPDATGSVSRTSGRRTAALVLTLIALVHSEPSGQTPFSTAPSRAAGSGALTAGSTVEAELAAGRSHTYHLTLAAGAFLQIAIEQRGVNVAASLVRPDGREIVAVDAMDDEFRPEIVVALADAEGTYSLDVRPARAARTAGRYLIRVEALRLARPDDDVRVEAERIFARGRQVRTASRAASWPEALAEFTTALDRFRQLSDRRGEMKTLIELAITQYYLSLPEALGSAQEALRLARELDDRPAAARALRTAGNTLVFRGEPAEAIRPFEESTALSHAVGHRNAEAISLNDTAIAYRRMSDLESAVALYERALPLARATNDAVLEGNILNNLGVAYKNLGEYDRAHVLYEQALANRRAAKDDKGQYYALANLGNLHSLLGNHSKAQECLADALAIARQIGDDIFEANTLTSIGDANFARGEYSQALSNHRDSLAIRQRLGDRSGQALSIESAGRALNRLGRIDEAVTALGDALTIYRKTRDLAGERDTLGGLAEVERDRGDLAEALHYIEAAIDLDETLRARITSLQLRASFVAVGHDKYELFIDILQRHHAVDPTRGYETRALHVSERARARVLLDSLLEASVDLREGVEPALLERERSLQKQLSEASARLSRTLATGSSGNQATAAAERVDRLTAEYQDLQARIRRENPRYASITLPQPLTPRQIQEGVVDSDTVLLEFALGEKRSWVWAVTADMITSAELPARPVIEETVRSLYEAFTARQRQQGESAGPYARRVQAADARLDRERTAVGEMLLGGIARQLHQDWRGKRLAIVATGALEYLPFAALTIPAVPASTDAADSGRLRRNAAAGPLAAHHEIVHIPSASVLAGLRQEAKEREPARRTVAVLADPVFEVADPRVRPASGAAPPAGDGPGRRPTRHVSRIAERGGLVRLPFSREEAAAIVALAPKADVFRATDFKANRTTVLEGALTAYRVVHFATHGVFDAGSPAMSGLVLSLVDERGKPQDGFLRLNDIYNMRLNADLVVLSACQTALGKEIKGEGLVGLTRAFMYAGAPRIVASLWQVSDLATAELMKKFYRGVLTQRLRPAAALRAAQLEMSRDPRWKSPYYWAGFVLQGDWN